MTGVQTCALPISTVTLPASFNDKTLPSSVDDYYVGWLINVGSSPFAIVTAYNGTTKIATLSAPPAVGTPQNINIRNNNGLFQSSQSYVYVKSNGKCNILSKDRSLVSYGRYRTIQCQDQSGQLTNANGEMTVLFPFGLLEPPTGFSFGQTNLGILQASSGNYNTCSGAVLVNPTQTTQYSAILRGVDASCQTKNATYNYIIIGH